MSNFTTQLLSGQSNHNNALSNNDNRRSNNQHILLEGPSNSNKTTITMNMSHRLSNNDTCDYCQESTNIASNLPCHCCRILYIMPKSKKGTTFPIPIHYKHEANKDGIFWKEDNLKRIHTKYISNIKTLIAYILKLPTLNKKHQPKSGIIIEDIHEFFMDGDTKKDVLTIPDTLKLIEVIALVISTANAISQKNKMNMITLCTINNSYSNSASIKNVASNYVTIYLTIQPSTTSNDNSDWILRVENKADDQDGQVIYDDYQRANIAMPNNSDNYPKEKQLYLHLDLENDLLIWNHATK